MITTSYIGQFTTVRRNIRTVYDGVRINRERLEKLESNTSLILSILTNMKDHTATIMKHIHMQTPDVSSSFPADNNQQLDKFFSDLDGGAIEKKQELEYLLDTAVSSTSTKRTFCSGIIDALFTRDYVCAHRWPGTP